MSWAWWPSSWSAMPPPTSKRPRWRKIPARPARYSPNCWAASEFGNKKGVRMGDPDALISSRPAAYRENGGHALSADRMACLKLGNHADAARMPAAFELGVEEFVDDHQRQILADHAGAEGQHVGVVVLARQLGGIGLRTDDAADALELVGGERDAEAGAADGDAELRPSGQYHPRRLLAPLGIVGALGGRRTDILDRVAARLEVSHDSLPEVDAGVVGGDDDLGLVAHGLAPMLLSNCPAPRNAEESQLPLTLMYDKFQHPGRERRLRANTHDGKTLDRAPASQERFTVAC
ncbi:hypothetical protein KL86PLE_130191 [uncultured Pleomorphomonas sp.]|uniref:Uncharacterized protein n=1 Tax=uncultured Pleomorphomonas sp. TaxID=442121 RepID=A0A212LA51_9HYPH|nr:hypothetical protein KL86PLE_130191 [uncultured Pleomorphomonas sp.]